MTADYKVHGDVAVITLMNPPVNGLGLSTRVGITDGLEKANKDAAVKAIVLTGGGKAFSGGADIREFGSPKAIQEPNLLSVITACEKSAKPVVAAIHSVAMGGGLELALGCHYRIAAPGTSIALPEVKLGLIPGAGGTQRLPRVIGVEAALNMIVGGEAIKSDMLAMLPGQKLFDAMAQSAESLPEEALAMARKVAAAHADGSPMPLVKNLPCKHPQGDAYFQFARNMVKGMSKNFPAPAKCVDVVEAATKKKFDEGMQVEREAFINLMFTAESKSLRHLFLAERAASKIADVPSPVRMDPEYGKFKTTPPPSENPSENGSEAAPAPEEAAPLKGAGHTYPLTPPAPAPAPVPEEAAPPAYSVAAPLPPLSGAPKLAPLAPLAPIGFGARNPVQIAPQ
jgi:3-hydroxyacyl-CoA dehydrogenase